MPHFYFEFVDGSEPLHDSQGQTFETEQEARSMLIKVMADLAVEALPDGDHHSFQAELQDADRRPIYRTSLTLRGGWLERTE